MGVRWWTCTSYSPWGMLPLTVSDPQRGIAEYLEAAQLASTSFIPCSAM